jgi:glycerol-3-phosphate dehydrogenase
MKRNPEQIQNTVFDLLVIGGGIQGATICHKATQRGLRVLLLEKGDFCGSSSANSLKILHGGLRYLQNLDFKRMRDSILSRREMMRFAPHLITPLPCTMPAYGHGLKGKEFMRLAMLINDSISMDRNAGLLPEIYLPAGQIINKTQCLERIPGISTDNLHGASVWYDALAINTERLVLEYILQAADQGAICINYLQVNTLSKKSENGISVAVHDRLSNNSFTVEAKYVINSAGSAFEDLIPVINNKQPPTHWARGLNIVVRKNLFPDGAVALEKKFDAQKRMLFLVPWRENYTMIGTHYVEHSQKSRLFPVEKADIMLLVDEINAIYPPADLSFEDVSFYHAGLLPMIHSSSARRSDPPALEKESTIIDHGKHYAFANFFSIKGIKYTTAPHVADKVLKLIKPAHSYTDPTSLDKKVTQPKPKTDLDTYLNRKYGSRYTQIRPYIGSNPQWLDGEQSLLVGELDYFMQEEMSLHVSDVVFRRSDLGTAQCPPMDVLQRITQIMAKHFDWSNEQKSAELAQVLKRYMPLEMHLQ